MKNHRIQIDIRSLHFNVSAL